MVLKYTNTLVKYGYIRRNVGGGGVHSSPDRAVQVRALAGDIVMCSRARHYSYGASLPAHIKTSSKFSDFTRNLKTFDLSKLAPSCHCNS